MENKKNIWIINHYAFPYGYGFHTRQHSIAKMLIELGYNVTVFSSSYNHLKTKSIEMNNSIFKEEEFDDIKYIWIKSSIYNGNGFSRIRNIFDFSKNLNKIYKKIDNKPDIVWISTPQPFSIHNAIKIKKKYNAKLIFDERDIWPLTLQTLNGLSTYHPISILFRYLQLQGYKHSNLIVSPLDNLKEFVIKSGFKDKKIEYIPQTFVKFEIEEYELELPSNKTIIGYLGSIGESNSVFNLIKAARLLKKDESLFFVIVGDGPQLKELKDYVKDKKLTNIKFLGKLSKERAMYILSKCDILYKGNPDIDLYKYGIASVKLLEYLWFNKPIIHATNIKNDLVTLSNSGIKIKCDDENELSESILELKNNKELYKKLSNKGRKFVEENFIEEKIMKKLKVIMEEI